MLTKGSSVSKQVRSVCPFDSLEEGAVEATWTRQSTSSGSACSISRNKLLHQRSFAGTRWVWLKMWYILLISIIFSNQASFHGEIHGNSMEIPWFPRESSTSHDRQEQISEAKQEYRACEAPFLLCFSGSLLWVLVDHSWPIQKCIISYMCLYMYCMYIIYIWLYMSIYIYREIQSLSPRKGKTNVGIL